MAVGLLFTFPSLLGLLVATRETTALWGFTGFAMGVAWLSHRARRPDIIGGFASAACALGALEHAQILYDRFEPSPYGDDWAWRLIGCAPLILWTTAAVVAARGDRLFPVAAGLVLFGGPMEGFAVSAALMGMNLVARHGAKSTHTMKDSLSLFSVSALAALCVHGLTEDAAASVAPRLEETMRRWYPDDPTERAARVIVELVTLLASAAFVRGRTWGAFLLPVAGLGLIACASHFRGLVWGGGCVGHLQALHGGESMVFGLVAIAIAPWTGPVTRALVGIVRPDDAAVARSP